MLDKVNSMKQPDHIYWFLLHDETMTPETACSMTVSGVPSGSALLEKDLSGIVDFLEIIGGRLNTERRPILLLCEIGSERETMQPASAGADFFFAVFCNGKTCFSTLEDGNAGNPPSASDYVFRIPEFPDRTVLHQSAGLCQSGT